MPGITIQRTYRVVEEYEAIKERAFEYFGKYLFYPNIIKFNDFDRSITFSTERLVPTFSTNRPRVMLVFSNPHPYSIHQGMFLSPNTKGRENLFWEVMRDAGWLLISKENRNTKQLAEICLNGKYDGPFDLIFYCYYAFPTDYPQDIRRIFGKEYFNQVIEPEAKEEFRRIIEEASVQAVVTFNKVIFNLVSKYCVVHYVDRLMQGDLVRSQINGIDRYIPIFLTFPTGWRYQRQYKKLRKASLDTIRTVICNDLGAAER